MTEMIISQIANIFIAVVCVLIVNWLGLPLRRYGYKALDEDMDEDDRLFNILYRVIAPVVVCCALSATLATVCDLYCVEFGWVSLVYYWLMRLFLTILLRPLSLNVVSFILRSIISTALASYFFYGIGLSGVESLVPERNDVVFQFWLLAAIVIAKLIALTSKPRNNLEPYYFEAKRIADRLLTERFRQDVALRIVFYTVAIAEASHRSKPIRLIERFLSRVGLAKTTGLMQVKSEKPLTDEESVLLAADMIEAMWLNCLAKDGGRQINLKKTKKGYKYNLEDAELYLYDAVPIIYRNYSGSAGIDIQPMLDEASRQVLADLWITDEDITVKVSFPLTQTEKLRPVG